MKGYQTVKNSTLPQKMLRESHPAKSTLFWQDIDLLRSQKGKTQPNWPDWCFLPSVYWRALVEKKAKKLRNPNVISDDYIADCELDLCFIAWRYTQSIYRFNPEIYDALISTPLINMLPCDAFLRLPEWCVYIELNQQIEWNPRVEKIVGFFCTVDYIPEQNLPVLQFIMAVPGGSMMHYSLHLGPWSIEEAILRTYSEIAYLYDDNENHAKETAKKVMPLLSLVLYLCSNEPDIIRKDPESLVVRSKKSLLQKRFEFTPPEYPQVWNVGEEIANSLQNLWLQRKITSMGMGGKARLHTLERPIGMDTGQDQKQAKKIRLLDRKKSLATNGFPLY